MFGIGKKKEAGKAAAKEGENGVEDEIQFDFEEEDKLPFDDDDGFVEDRFADEGIEEESPQKGLRQSLSQRNLLLILLFLLVLGGGAYYYLNSPLAPPPQPAAPIKAKVVVQPTSPQATAVKPETLAATAPAATAAKASEPTPAATAPSAVKGEVAPAPAAKQPFTLSAGAFLNKENQQKVEKKIRHLGYTAKVQTVFVMVPMTRLLLGIYDDPAAAQARSQELLPLIPDLFSLQEGDKVALYAGSFQNSDQARRYAEKLHQQGILADEEAVSVRMPLKKISFGSFANRAEAEKAAKRAMDAGLTAQVAKR